MNDVVVFLSEKIMHEEKREKEQSIEKKNLSKIFKNKKQKILLLFAHFFTHKTHTVMRALRTTTTNKNKSAHIMSSSDEEEDEEEREESEEEEENSDDSDSEYHHSQDDENFIREQNVKALRDGLPLSKIRYASVLSNLKPPEPDEVILKRHFAPLVPGGALQTGTFLVCLLRFVSRVR